MSGPIKTAIVPSWTWGSSATVRVDNATAPGPPPQNSRVVTAQLAQVSLPEPAVCSLYFQASVRSALLTDTVTSLTLNLLEGIGRVTIPRQVVFLAQPAPNAPLEFTLPFVPVHALNIDIAADVRLNNPAGSLVEIECYLVLSPLTRIQQKQQELSFGMALPGEADDLDDELREELEAEGPTVQQMMVQGLKTSDTSEGGEVEGEEPEHDDDDDDDDDDDETPEVPAWLSQLVQTLTQRLGRKPSKLELASAVRRLRQRARRREERSRG